MTELHSHILPGIDDGANALTDSLELISMELDDGVNQIALTPHFYPQQDTLEDFIKRREAVCNKLTAAVNEKDIPVALKLGAEVHYSPSLIDLDVRPLSLGDTGYILIELPYMQHPAFFDRVIRILIENGLTPIIAHVDRYSYSMNNLHLLYEWTQLGCMIQVNAESIIDTETSPRLLYKLIRWGLVHVIASDAHSVYSRPPMLAKAYARIEKDMGRKYADRLRTNADSIFAGEHPDIPEPHEPVRSLFGWRLKFRS